jgi:hypothetical protein
MRHILSRTAGVPDCGEPLRHNDDMQELGKILLGLGLLLAGLGAALLLAGRLHLPLGRMPGDFTLRGRNTVVWIPLGTSLLLSAILSLVWYFISRFRR